MKRVDEKGHAARKHRKKEPKKKPIRIKGRGRIGNFSYVCLVLNSKCGTSHGFPLPAGPLPVTAVFANMGLCSIKATILGVGGPQSVAIPSAGGANPQPQTGILFHPAGTSITVDRLPTVAGGDCRVFIALVYP